MPPNVLSVPAHTCAVGLYFMGCPVHSVPAQPHKTKPCSQEYRTGAASKSSPQGVTIPNANAGMHTESKNSPDSTKSGCLNLHYFISTAVIVFPTITKYLPAKGTNIFIFAGQSATFLITLP